MSQQVIISEAKSPNIILRFLWFILIGWWVGYLVVSVAFFCEAIIIGFPLALYLFDRLPAIMTLKARRRRLEVYEDRQGRIQHRALGPKQYSLLLRIVYFLLIGWWLSGLWISATFAVAATIIGTPVAFWMVDRIPFIGSLARI